MYTFMFSYIRFVGVGWIGSEISDSVVFTPLGLLSQVFLVTQVSCHPPGLLYDHGPINIIGPCIRRHGSSSRCLGFGSNTALLLEGIFSAMIKVDGNQKGQTLC
jgi:hypothetical protein